MKRKMAISVGLFLVVGLLAVVAYPVVAARSNCGGNSYALSVCKNFELTADMTACENQSKFEIGRIAKDVGQGLSHLAQGDWGVSGADFLIRTNFVFGTASDRSIVIVCLKEFGNVPQPNLWNLYRQNPAHAVGYSDGTSGLISPDEFRALNLAGFITLSELVTNFELTAFKP